MWGGNQFKRMGLLFHSTPSNDGSCDPATPVVASQLFKSRNMPLSIWLFGGCFHLALEELEDKCILQADSVSIVRGPCATQKPPMFGVIIILGLSVGSSLCSTTAGVFYRFRVAFALHLFS
jgi:hypothetical protein